MTKRPATGARPARRTRHVLLASEGRPFSEQALSEAALLAREHQARVTVLLVLRIWGTGLGLPHPGLLPSRREADAGREEVARAVQYLEECDLRVRGEVIGTRRPAKVIVREAGSRECDLIVMAADRRGHLSDLRWSNEPYRVALRAEVPVYLVKEHR